MDVLIEVTQEAYLALCERESQERINLHALCSLPAPGARVIALTSSESCIESIDFRSRCFTPSLGVKEDHACGVVHLIMGLSAPKPNTLNLQRSHATRTDLSIVCRMRACI